MKTYTKICDCANKIINYLLVAIFTVMTIIAITEVVRRYILGVSFPWADEALRYFLVWMGFLGGSVALRKGKLARFDLGHNKLSEKTRTILAIIVGIIIIVLFAFTFVYSYRWATSFSAQKSRMNTMPFTLQPVYASVPVGMIFCELFSVERLIKDFLHLKEVDK